MNKEKILILLNKVYGALDTISVSGYANIKTLSNCMEALRQLANDVDALSVNVEQSE